MVLYLGGRVANQLFVPWGELLAALSDKNPELSRNRLMAIGNNFKTLFACNDKGIQLKESGQEFLEQYLSLAEGVEVIHSPANSFLSHPSSVRISKKVLVSDIPCVYDKGQGGTVFFHLGSMAYRLKNVKVEGDFVQGQRLKAVLCFRKDVNRYEMKIIVY
jgi:hypothetical protein